MAKVYLLGTAEQNCTFVALDHKNEDQIFPCQTICFYYS